MRLMPLDQGGAAAGVAVPKGAEDRTGWPRFGLKGPGTLDWFRAQGIALPEINKTTRTARGLRLCRLGMQDILMLPESRASEAIAEMRAIWEKAPSGYSSWREEAWAWLHLDAATTRLALPRLTAIDLRPKAFGLEDILQTRVAHQDVVMMRDGDGVDLFFDIASTAQVIHDLAQALTAGETRP